MGTFRNGNTGEVQQRRLGGTRAVLFIYAMEGLETMAFISNAVSLVTYFNGYMNFSLTKSATSVTNWMGTSCLLAILGGFVSDTYLSRFMTSAISGCIESAGYVILAVQAYSTSLRPFPCKDVAPSNKNQCETADSGQVTMLFLGLYLVALGSGGVKGGLPSLGADQFDENDPSHASQVASFFNWFVFSLNIGAMVGVTFVIWITTNHGWDWGFGVCFVGLLFSVVFLSMGWSIYRHSIPNGSPITRILQVFVVAIRKRHLPIPELTEELYELHEKESGVQTNILQRTDQFRFLDRAAMRMNTNSAASLNMLGPWNICTITQVEETKILIRMVPIIISTIFLNTVVSQLSTFSGQQSLTMDTSLFGYHIPSLSLPIIPQMLTAVLVPFYDRLFVPFIRKFTGIPTGIRPLQRIGVGLVLSAISMAVAALVETRRKSVALENNMMESSNALPMSVFWLGFQYGIAGAADLFTLVGLLQFFYSESPVGMKSLSTAISWSSMAFGFYLSSIVVEAVNTISGGWLESDNLNRDKLDYFYWLLFGLSVINFGYYLLCSSWYRYKKVEEVEQGGAEDDKGKYMIEMGRISLDN